MTGVQFRRYTVDVKRDDRLKPYRYSVAVSDGIDAREFNGSPLRFLLRNAAAYITQAEVERRKDVSGAEVEGKQQ